MYVVLVDKDGDRFEPNPTRTPPGSRIPAILTGVEFDKDGEPTVLVVRYLHEMSNEENESWVNARVSDARAWWNRQRGLPDLRSRLAEAGADFRERGELIRVTHTNGSTASMRAQGRADGYIEAADRLAALLRGER